MMRILFTLSAVLVEILSLRRFLSCWLFSKNFYYTPDILVARVIQAVNADSPLPHVITKLLHNKLMYFGWGILQTLLQYWDSRFLSSFISFVGMIGVYLAIWYLLSRDRKMFLSGPS